MRDTHLDAAIAFYCDPFTPLLMAMIRAEGGEAAFVKAIQCSYPKTKDFPEALARACKTLRNRVVEYQSRDLGPLMETQAAAAMDPWTGEALPRRLLFTTTFIEFLGARWAPVGADNDPTALNVNWVPNVTAMYYKRPEDITQHV